MSVPSNATAPLSGVTIPRIMRNVVVFPAPLPTEQPDDLFLNEHEAHFFHHRPSAVALAQLGRLKKVHMDGSPGLRL